jgi:hypothetical protein
MTDLLNHPVLLVLAIIVGVVGTARFTRLLVHDTFPPSAWLRAKWGQVTADRNGDDGSWTILLSCHWCASVWSAALCLGLFWLGTLVPWIGATWWWLYGILAVSYLAGMIVERDGDETDE